MLRRPPRPGLPRQLDSPHRTRRLQVKPDPVFLQKVPLWKAFRTCEHKARNKNTKRRANSMSVLRDPDGKRLQFTHEDRASIEPSILKRIRRVLVCARAAAGRQELGSGPADETEQ